jgi:hypothetical protein
MPATPFPELTAAQFVGHIRQAPQGPGKLQAAPAERPAAERSAFRFLVQCVVTGDDTLTTAAAHPVVVITRERGLRAERDWALDRGLVAARWAGDRTTQAMLLYERGEGLAGHRSAWTEALACWTEALALIDPAENPALVASLRDRIAYAYRTLGRHEDAEREITAVAETIAADDSDGAKLLVASFQA